MATESDTSEQRRRYDPSMSRRTRKPIKMSREEINEESQLEKTDGFQRMSLEELMLEGGAKGPEKGGGDTDDQGINGAVHKLMDTSTDQEKKKIAAAQKVMDADQGSGVVHKLMDVLEEEKRIAAAGAQKVMDADQGSGVVVHKLVDVLAEEEKKIPTAAATTVHNAESEKKLAIVLKQGDSVGGAKAAGMVTRYVKVLNDLIKARRNSKKEKKKNELRLLK